MGSRQVQILVGENLNILKQTPQLLQILLQLSVAIQYNVLSDTSSPIKSKRNDDAPLDLCESPLKKQKAVSNKFSDATSSRDTTTVDHISAEKEYAKMNTKKKDLSDLGHKKRALKAPVSLFKGEKLKAPKIVLSEFEKEIYHLATKRIRDSDPNPECVRIGRMSIALREFGDTMHPKKWVGTFAMNVYTEALMYDQNKLENPNLRKGFLTSAEVVSVNCSLFSNF